MIEGKIDTVLAQWLRAASPRQREDLAERAGTSVGYLRLLAGVHRENPKVRLALAIVSSAARINAITALNSVTSPGLKPGNKTELPTITLEDLAKPTRHGKD